MTVGVESVTVSLVELRLEFDPVETEGVEEAFHDIHS